jgi:hypothetical protein
MRDSIFRYSFTLGTALFCFGFTYYGTHSPSLCVREDAQHSAYWSARRDVEKTREKLGAYLKKEEEAGIRLITPEETLGSDTTVSFDGFSFLRSEFRKLRATLEQGVETSEEELKEATRRTSVVRRERLVVLLGSGFGVLGGLGLMVHGFFGWRRFNASCQRGK